MEKELTNETVKNLLEKEGKVKGDLLLAYFHYIQKTEGDKGLSMVENRLKSVGVEIKESEIKPFSWYPVGYEPLIVLAGKETFDWNDEDIFSIGKDVTKLSLIVRMMLHFFVSVDKVFEESPKYWRNSYDFGMVEPVGREGDVYVLRIKGYDIHPISCIYNAGYIIGIAEMAGGKGMKIDESVCTHKGGDMHEYRIKTNSKKNE